MNSSQHICELVAQTKADLGGHTPLAELGESIIRYLYSRPTDHLKHLTHGSLKSSVGAHDDQELLLVVNYLAGERAKVFDTKFEFYDESSDSFYPLSIDEIRQAKKTGALVNPCTGEEVRGFESNVMLYFVISPHFMHVKEGT